MCYKELAYRNISLGDRIEVRILIICNIGTEFGFDNMNFC